MNVKTICIALLGSFLLSACEKEYSVEDFDGSNSNIVGINCRISKISYTDSATSAGIGSIQAIIDSNDNATNISIFDSLSGFLQFFESPVYVGDTVRLNTNEYYVTSGTSKLVQKFHGFSDPTNPLSISYDVAFTYNTNGNLIKKTYNTPIFPTGPVNEVNYNYNATGNLESMTDRNLITGLLISDASLSYAPFLLPRNYIYIFPDEELYGAYNQFYNYGKKSLNAIEYLKVRHYNAAGIVTDSLVSTFTDYQISADNYVLKVKMNGDEQPCIPVKKGILKFSYHCK